MKFIGSDFSYDTSSGCKIIQAMRLAEQFFETELHIILGRRDEFTHTEDSVMQVFNHLASNHKNRIIIAKLWKPRNPWTSAVATTFKNKPGEVYINVRKINQRSIQDYVNTLVHESCHVLGYGHGSNSPKGKENSVPYWLGAQAEEWAKGRGLQ